MVRGKVKRFSDEEGYGFVTPEAGGDGLLVRYSEIVGEGVRTLVEGTKVEFEVAERRRGKQTSGVEVVGG